MVSGWPGCLRARTSYPRPGSLMRLVIRLAPTQLWQPGLGLLQVLLGLEADVKLLGNGLVRGQRGAR